MIVHTIDPLRDPRWVTFIEQHPRASIFHTPGWLEALHRTYGYEPVALTTSAPGEELRNGLVFCRVRSWLTGRRMVSLPFSDHCEPLVESLESLKHLVSSLESNLEHENWKYFELRPLTSYGADLVTQTHLQKSETFYIHVLDLRPELDKIFRGFHKKSTQDKIHRAERERLTYEEGRSESILAKFYYLLLLTRRRHQLPPQPLFWFRNLINCVDDKLKIRVVSKDGQPITSTVTLSYRNLVVAKYGCSDSRFNHLGGMPFLLWKAIHEGKEQGAHEYDFGRSDPNNTGLIHFKNNWGANCWALDYYRFPIHTSSNSGGSWRMHLIRKACERLPDPVLTTAGRLLYRHMG